MAKWAWRRDSGGQQILVIVLLASALLLVPSLAGAASIPIPSAAEAALAPSPLVKSGTSCGVGVHPVFPAYDPVTHYVYVPNQGSANLSIVNDVCKIVATIAFPSGAQPYAAAFDPTNDRVYVTDNARDSVYEISGTKLVGTISTKSFDGPTGIADDPGDALMAVANGGSNTVTFLSGSAVLGTVAVGSGPYQFAFDPRSNRLLVTNEHSDNVTSLDAFNPFAGGHLSIGVGTEPLGIAFDPATSEDYVANFQSNNVTVINGVGAHFGAVKVGTRPEGVVWDQANLSVDVVSNEANIVSLIQGKKVVETITGPFAAQLSGIAYEEVTDQEFVTGYVTDEVYIFGDPTTSAGAVSNGTTCPVGNEANFDGYDPVDHDIYVPNALSRSLSILSGACKVVATITFPSKALPYAAAFDPTNNQVYVTDQRMDQIYVVNGTTLVKTIHDAAFDFPQGIAFDPGDAVMAVADLGAGTVLFLSGNAVSGSTTVGGEPQLLTYDPYFGRLLITNIGGDNVTSLNALDPPGGGNINIRVGVDPIGIAFDYATSTDYVANEIGGNVTEINGYGAQYGSIPVGSAPYGVTWDAAKLSVYVANIDSGNISVIQGASVVRTITTPSGTGPTGIAYDEATDQVFVTSNGAVYVYN